MYFLIFLLITFLSTANSAYNETLALKFWNYIRITECSVANIQSLQCGPICSSIQAEMKYVEASFNESTNMLAWVGYSVPDDVIYVNFRGSRDSIPNWLHNFDYFRQDYPDPKSSNAYPPQSLKCPGCKVHTGFYDAYYSLREQVLISIETTSQKSGCKKIFVVGYSLGAAMANHAVLDIIETQTQYTAVGIYTFGCPRTGDKNFAEFFDNNVPNAFRITHYKDVVPHVPIIAMGFEHTQQEVWYTSDKTLDHVLCVGNEDQHCSDSEIVVDVYDHLHYMNEDVDVLENYCNGIQSAGIAQRFLQKLH
eukprot:TRINITY_DN1638_c0_g1_i1.p1 TRINITY_DN1638_c0_g1~~TRINITY_DN1638_c0_g1_i1.p1  ORF type:complete len:308 (+),score=23.13 TRINITY_DN1638_c0_g1_i1:169-1092(+)